MIEHAKWARPYAKAAFEYANECGRLSEWNDVLCFLASVISQPEVMQFLCDPRRTDQQHLDLVLGLSEGMDASIENFIRLLAINRRLLILPSIQKLFDQFRAIAEKTLSIEVCSVIPLTEEERTSIQKQLSVKFGRQAMISYEIAPDLLGGLLIKAGDCVIDASVRGQLQRMRSVLLTPAAVM